MSRTKLAAGVAALATLSATGPASAAIVCEGNFQVIGGERLATPYCQDTYLAAVAREYGMRASALEIRENPNFKRYVCRFVGQDIRVQQACGSVNEFRGPRGR